jgi:hypothetical protein
MTSVDHQSNLKEDFLFITGLTLVTLVLYRGILNTYAYTDVYEYLLNGGNDNFINVFFQHGRMLYGIFNKLLFTTFTTVEEARFIRLVGLTGGILFLWAGYFLLRQYRWEPWMAALIMALFATTPSFGIIVSWGATYQIPWGLLCGLAAGILATRKLNILNITGSIVLGVCALMFYQPSYTIFIIPVFLSWLRYADLKKLLIPLSVFAATFLVYLLTFRLILEASGLTPTERSSMDFNMLTNLVWFFDGPLRQAFSYNLLFLPNFWKNLLRILLPVILILVYIRHFEVNVSRKTILHILFLILFLVLSLLPNMMSGEKWISFRTMPTLFLILSILMGIAIGRIREKRLRFISGILLLVVCYVAGQYNIRSGFMEIQQREYMVIRQALENLPTGTEKITILPADMKLLEDHDVLERVVTDEYGRLSTPSDWVPVPLVQLILRETGKNLPVEIIERQGVHPGAHLLDVGKSYLNESEND